MVKKLSDENKKAIYSAIAEAEKETSAEIVFVVAPASDSYQSHIFLFGLLIGSFICALLWGAKIFTAFPLLFMVQIAFISAFSIIHSLRYFFIHFIPRQLLHHLAGHRAYAEYVSISQKLPASIPLVVIYISLAEHYAHILSDRFIREKIPGSVWDSVVSEFTVAITKDGLQDACTATIQKIANILAPHFPAQENENYISDQVI